jgi:CheY-like chemotaxis protein
MPLQLFYSYAHEDAPLRDELDTHLALLRRRGVIAPWHDRRIAAGDDWRAGIDEHLERANLILLLVSPDFLASDYCYDVEMKRAMERHRSRQAAVVPVIARPVDLEGAPFADVQALPKDAKPVTTWPNRDEAWTDVAKGVRGLAEKLSLPVAPSGPGAPMAPPPPATIAEVPHEPYGPPAPPVEKSQPSPPPGDATQTAPLGVSGGLSLASTPERRADIALERALAGFQGEMVEAMRARAPGEALRPSDSWRIAERIAAIAEWKRVLWVDDRPENNRFEIAALNRLQIEVVTATSTDEALALLDAPASQFDLVISDWSRPSLRSMLGGSGEGLRLVHAMRRAGSNVPFVVYHAVVSPEELARRREAIRAEGGQGATFRPNELFELVTRLLSA